MKVTGLTTGEQLAELINVCYPAVPGISVHIGVKIEDIVREYEDGDEPEPPAWNAGGGSPTVKSGQQKFSVALSEFLDEFYMDTDAGSHYARVEEPTDLIEENVFNAYIGAVGEHLVRRPHLGIPPEWPDDSA
jgi:hypothetical protein